MYNLPCRGSKLLLYTPFHPPLVWRGLADQWCLHRLGLVPSSTHPGSSRCSSGNKIMIIYASKIILILLVKLLCSKYKTFFHSGSYGSFGLRTTKIYPNTNVPNSMWISALICRLRSFSHINCKHFSKRKIMHTSMHVSLTKHLSLNTGSHCTAQWL